MSREIRRNKVISLNAFSAIVLHMKAYAILLASLFQIFGSNAPMVFNWGQSISERSNEANAIITPPGIAFAIWGPIFLSCVLFGIYAVKKRTKIPQIIGTVGTPSISIFCLSGIWGLWVPFHGTDFISLIIISLAAFIGLMLMHKIGNPKKYNGFENGLVIFPIALISGWLLTATTIAILSAANVHNLSWMNTESLVVIIPLLFFLVATVAFTIHKTKNYWYAIAPVWGLANLGIGKLSQNIDTEIGIASLAGALLVSAIGLDRFLRQ